MYALINTISLAELQGALFTKKMVVCTVGAVAVALIGLFALAPAFIASGGIDVLQGLTAHMSKEAISPTTDTNGSTLENFARSQSKALLLLAFVDEQMQSVQDTESLAHVRALFTSHADIHVVRTAIQGKKITVTGIADSRTALLAMQSAVRADTRFASSELPISDLSGRDNLFPFTFAIALHK
jgi:Tfp pilus assembly protein PilN